MFGAPIEGETPIDGSGLRVRGITTRRELNEFEAINISKPIAKYLGGKITKRTARFDFAWMLRLHQEMFGDV